MDNMQTNITRQPDNTDREKLHSDKGKQKLYYLETEEGLEGAEVIMAMAKFLSLSLSSFYPVYCILYSVFNKPHFSLALTSK